MYSEILHIHIIEDDSYKRDTNDAMLRKSVKFRYPREDSEPSALAQDPRSLLDLVGSRQHGHPYTGICSYNYTTES